MIGLKFEGVIVTERIGTALAEHLRTNLKGIEGIYFTPSTILVTGSRNNQGQLRFLDPGTAFHFYQTIASVNNGPDEVHLFFDFHRQALRPVSTGKEDSFQRFIFRNALVVSLKQSGYVRISLMRMPVYLGKTYHEELVLFEDFLPWDLMCLEDALVFVPENYRDFVRKARRQLQRSGGKK